MAFYTGQSYRQDKVSIGPPDLSFLQSASINSDVKDSVEHWVSEAKGREDILYFTISLREDLIGQILLHDRNAHTGESLVAYHLFCPQVRGQGFGTLALRLLQSYVLRQTALKKLVIITSRDNLASQHIARKCGFQYVGTSREDPVNDMVFEWHVPLRSEQNKAILKKIVDIFNTGDLSEVDLIFSPGYIDHQKPPKMDIDGPEEFKQIVTDLRESLRKLDVMIEDLISEDDKVVGRLHWHLIDLAGKEIHRETIEILRFVDGQVVEHWGAEAWRTKI